MMVAVEFHKTLLQILSKRMKLLHVEKSFDILGNRGLKWEHRGGIMGVGKSVLSIILYKKAEIAWKGLI